MADPAYPAARVVARRVEAHFNEHRAAFAGAASEPIVAPVPTADAIEGIINAAFWASLRREEGRAPAISLAFLPAAVAGDPLTFESWLPLTPASLARLAPAVERPGIHLGVWRDDKGELGVWGTTRRLPLMTFVLEVVTSGLLVIKHRSEAFGKFVNVAVLEGDEVKIVSPDTAREPGCPGVVASLLGVEIKGVTNDAVNVLVQIGASMRAHHRGGALMIIPSDNQLWPDSVVTPVLYAVSPPFSELALLMQQREAGSATLEWQEDVRRAVEALAGLTAVDGATLITDHFDLVAFGAKLMRRRGSTPVEHVLLTEPVEGSTRSILNPYQLGGTRHFSAAQFVFDQPGSTALVASQDGRFTIFKWSAPEGIVHAHRVEALLL